MACFASLAVVILAVPLSLASQEPHSLRAAKATLDGRQLDAATRSTSRRPFVAVAISSRGRTMLNRRQRSGVLLAKPRIAHQGRARAYTCGIGEGMGIVPIKMTWHNDEIACGSQCDRHPKCISYDWESSNRSTACRLFAGSSRIKNGGVRHRRFCLLQGEESRLHPYDLITGADSNDPGFPLADGAQIPRVVYMTGPWDKVPKMISRVRERNFGHLPNGTVLKYFNDEQMARSAREISGLLRGSRVVNGAYSAFSALRPGAFRADLWRYMVLWAFGGMYLDVKIALKEPVTKWVDFHNDTMALVEDIGLRSRSGTRQGYWNAMMAAAPKSWVMGRVIRHVVQNIRNRSYGKEDAPKDCLNPSLCSSAAAVLGITGPAALHRAVDNAMKEAESSWNGRGTWSQSQLRKKLEPSVRAMTQKWDTHDSSGQLTGLHSLVQSAKTKETVAAINDDVHRLTHQASGPYSIYWKKHTVYCNELGPPCKHYAS